MRLRRFSLDLCFEFSSNRSPMTSLLGFDDT
jgi:hypothetical protein